MFVTAYMSRSQKFGVEVATDDRGEVKIKIASAFDTVTVGLSREQAAELVAKVEAEITGNDGKKDGVPF